MQKKRIIIIGTGRSGTAYTSMLLKQCGIDVGHERMGKDGVSSWYLTTKFEAFDGLDWEDLESDPYLIGQQIRDPLKTIPSLMTFNKQSQSFIRRSGAHNVKPKNRLHDAMLHGSTAAGLGRGQVKGGVFIAVVVCELTRSRG